MNKRDKHILNLMNIISDKFNDYSYDNYGNLVNNNKTRRFKYKKSVIRMESKFNKSSWLLIQSFYYKDLCIKDNEIYIIKNIKKVIW